MLHIEDDQVRQHLLDGNFGLEKESLRVLANGTFAHTPHPFPDDKNIVKDFCENQTEINTGVHPDAAGAVEELVFHNRRILKKMAELPEQEYLWPFSNPPHITGESDIPIAIFQGEEMSKGAYRQYLADKYGRYKMAFSGIHVNYSLSDRLIEADYACALREGARISLREHRDALYLRLAKHLSAAGWILVAVTAASPVMDGSFLEKDRYGEDAFLGMASVRCSEMGYWNEFAPIFDYSSIAHYADSIANYVKKGLLQAPSELYYPVRIKPSGENTLDSLKRNGINHIELRMFDLNPLLPEGVDVRDILFAQLLMLWILSTPTHPLTEGGQVQAIQNFKNAAHYDLKTVRMITPYGDNTSLVDAAVMLIDEMITFYERVRPDMMDVLTFERDKFIDPQLRYAWRIRREYGTGFADKAMALAMQRTREALD